LASYDLEQFVDAVHWCAEGQRRFAGNPRFVQCQLWVMTSKAEAPDVAKAWRLVGDLEKVTPRYNWQFERLKAQIQVAAVLARAGLKDSARHLLLKSRGTPEIDPTYDLVYLEAFVRTLLGDKDEALRLLKQRIAARPEKRDLASEFWWFRDLANDPRYRELAGKAR
jgi:serine/threonine-protein kinase